MEPKVRIQMKPKNTFKWMMLYVVCGLCINVNSNELRIVSLTPSNTAIVRELGLSHRLLGITKFCTQPNHATQASIIGTINHPNIELVMALKPTLVLGNVESNRIETLDKIESVGLPLVRLGPSQSLQEIIRDVNKVAALTHRQESAACFINQVTEYLNEVQTLLKDKKQKRVFVEIWDKPLITVSKMGFIHHVIEISGGENIFADAAVAYPKVSMESIIVNQPEAIFILTHSLFRDDRKDKYHKFPQMINTSIHQTDASEISQPSLTAFVYAVEYFAALLHPTVQIPKMDLIKVSTE